jgi:hypothetical protein
MGCTRVDNQIITEGGTDVDRQPDGRVVHLLGPNRTGQHDLSLLPRGHDRVRRRQWMGPDRTQNDLLRAGYACGCLRRRRAPWLDLTDDDGRPTGQHGQGCKWYAQSLRIHGFVPPWTWRAQ